MLKMKSKCERCQSKLTRTATAFICSYECTFCESCTDEMGAICPNCSGELVRRPRRDRRAASVAVSQIRKRLPG
ncbi:MAG: DUF1272 domain-containing protein [Gammaproteobacteria bacterium]|nr:DUF1272 domain-containing protein [Gammaproteobacteria bacterium]